MAYAAHEATALGFLASWRSHLMNLGWIALRFGVDLFGPFALGDAGSDRRDAQNFAAQPFPVGLNWRRSRITNPARVT